MRDSLRALGESLDEVGRAGRARLSSAGLRLREVAVALACQAERAARGGPRVILFSGPSGGGKSTLINALADQRVSLTSRIERPATRGAIAAACTETMNDGVVRDRLFETLSRSFDAAGGGRGRPDHLDFVVARNLPPNVILVDGPDYDTTEDANRALAARLLPWPDAIVFVTSQERYGDRAALETLAAIRTMEIPVLFVLNKVTQEAGESSDILDDFRERTLAPTGFPQCRVAGIAWNQSGSPPAALVAPLREFVSETRCRPPSGARLRRLCDDVREQVVRRAEAIAQEKTHLMRAVVDAARADRAFEPHSALGAVRRLESESRFWLRYAPSNVVRGVWNVLRRPSRVFAGATFPATPAREEFETEVLAQAWEMLQDAQIVVRETLKRHSLGRTVLEAPDFEASELSESDLRDAFAPLVDSIHDFATSRIRSFRESLEGRRAGLTARVRFWAIDKTLKLVVLCLSLTVIPPLLFELLRAIGHPTFSSEVDAALERWQGEFREILERTLDRQLNSYRTTIESLGPPEPVLRRLEAALAALESIPAGGADGE